MNQPITRERAVARSSPSQQGPADLAGLVVTTALNREPAASAWRQTAELINAETNLRERRLRRGLASSDALALGIGLLVAVGLASADAFQPFTVGLFPAVVAAAKIFGLYESDRQRIRKTTVEELPQLAQLGALLVLAIWLADELLLGGPAAKQQALLLGTSFFVAAGLGRRTTRRLINRRLPRERCLFAGDERSFTRLHEIFGRHELGADLVARIPIQEAMLHSRPGESGPGPQLLEVIARAGAHRLIIGPHTLSNAMTFELLEAARDAGTRVSLLPDMLEVAGSSVDFDDLYGVTLLGVRHTQLSRSSRRLKRVFDLAGATLMLVACAPVMIAIAIAVRVDSSGPTLFRQLRIGRAGQPFLILKFRTMIDGADALKDALRERNEADGLFKIHDDPRVTNVGRWLRRTSLDELPQIFNVILGQMSLVGPRPLVAEEDGRILGVRRGRLRLTPGMTGQWQIAGSSRVPLQDMVKLDHLYVSNWTLWDDIKILLRTIPYVLAKRGQ